VTLLEVELRALRTTQALLEGNAVSITSFEAKLHALRTVQALLEANAVPVTSLGAKLRVLRTIQAIPEATAVKLWASSHITLTPRHSSHNHIYTLVDNVDAI
jgi:hypothetical protein